MDTIDSGTDGELRLLSKDSFAKRSSLPSIPTLFVVALLIPGVAALSNQWLLEHFKNSPRASYVLYPWMALSAALISWCAGRYLHPAFLRCAVFVWCLALLDLLTFIASLGNTHGSHFGYMLVSAEINLVILWTILGCGGWQWRLPAMLAVLPLVVLLGTSIGSTWWLNGGLWHSGGWFEQSWQLVVLLAAVMAMLVCVVLRWFGFKLQPQLQKQTADSQLLGTSQFGVKHMLVWSAAIVPLLLIARSLDFLFITQIRQNEFFPLTLLSVSLATVSLIAIWIVLGAGSWLIRLPLLLLAPMLITAALEFYSSSAVSQFGPYSSYRRPMSDLFIEMTGNWFAWIWQGTALLAALLLFPRASGYQFVRSVKASAVRN